MKKREVCFDEDRSGDVSNMVSRRQLLKALAATSGAVVATQLPTEWAKPVIEVGILPAHAQASANPTSSPTPSPTTSPTPTDGLPPLTCIEPGSPIDVVLALDRSASISSYELDQVKEAAKRFVDGLDLSQEQIGLVSFNLTATLDQPLTQDSDTIKAAIDSLSSGGGTDISAAIQVCDQELTGVNQNVDNKSVIILISDGVSDYDPLPAADAAKAKGIRILTVGVGLAFDIETLRAIASTIDDFYFAPTTADLITIFDPECDL